MISAAPAPPRRVRARLGAFWLLALFRRRGDGRDSIAMMGAGVICANPLSCSCAMVVTLILSQSQGIISSFTPQPK